jgi:SAM-dependent methyltransferase
LRNGAAYPLVSRRGPRALDAGRDVRADAPNPLARDAAEDESARLVEGALGGTRRMQLEARTWTNGGRIRRKALHRRRPSASQADRADRYLLYQKAVQDPEGDVARLRRMYERIYGGSPRILREDFCGTAALAAAWVAAHRGNRAFGIDLDPEPLEWGRRHNIARLRPEQQARVTLVEGDVRAVRTPRADVLAAFNFSFFLFKQRAELLRYFKRCRAHLADRGLFAIDAYGGPESLEPRQDRRRLGGFTYVWDQARYDPITHDATCHIHFEFRDGSRIDRAWTYHWRLWTLPELRELLAEAGFASSTVYWEGTELATNEPNGIFRPRAHAEPDPAWIAYLVAAKTDPR